MPVEVPEHVYRDAWRAAVEARGGPSGASDEEMGRIAALWMGPADRAATASAYHAGLARSAAQTLRDYADRHHTFDGGYGPIYLESGPIDADAWCTCGESWSEDEGGCTERAQLLADAAALDAPAHDATDGPETEHAVRVGRERADAENHDRGYRVGYDIGYAGGRRDADAERADVLCTCPPIDVSHFGGAVHRFIVGKPNPACPQHGTAAPAQTAASGTTPPGEGDPVGAGTSGAQRAAQAVADVNICRRSERVDDPTAHSWRFDGDDPRIECVYCGQVRDSQTGRVIRDGAR